MGVQDDCGEGHKALSGQAVTAGPALEGVGLLVRTPLASHCCTSELRARDFSATNAKIAMPLSPAT